MMSSKRDYYEILSISRSADETTIKKAFRQIALEYHPDRNPSAEAGEKFREAQEAYEALSDPQKRAHYDQFGHSSFRGGGSGFDTSDVFSGFQSIFEDFFAGSGGERARARGADLLTKLEIDFREAILGCTKTIEIPREGPCEPCHGKGIEPGTKPETCHTCKGRGKITQNQGFFILSQTCPHCRGQGHIVKHPCRACHGEGVKREKRKLDINVPAGIDSGLRLKLQNEGHFGGSGGQRGDLYVEITVRPDDIFERDGSDLYVKIKVPYTKAVLGGDIEVPLIEGSRRVHLPSHTQTPHSILVKGEGVKDLRRHGRGNLIVEVLVETPKHLSSRAKELLRELDGEMNPKPQSDAEEPAKESKGKKKKRGFFS